MSTVKLKYPNYLSGKGAALSPHFFTKSLGFQILTVPFFSSCAKPRKKAVKKSSPKLG